MDGPVGVLMLTVTSTVAPNDNSIGIRAIVGWAVVVTPNAMGATWVTPNAPLGRVETIPLAA